ncbi:hypothetical protein CAS74_000593 [Pichia kudriavzevii]|uniref:DUF1014-domain-containing protein n=1 Tax=Pichia kudriavzevii TaxID=4909 RepID=A0A099P6H2_PICKU|nr:uncharacterized protein C5L36_0C05750 [Pichia kudriavzevii]AWU76649.1 hypothetical protein C5L36_0C05750 [Pichia kudriavzevii]KGK39631.1 hypothetical protein JL09_g1145 [Pichia kudriavzevii]ONH73913.1 hypothetical protein BOH78_2746 [Pichia kudriavzevii]OUT24207.1 hypothetical protein CAS74_000593 [Pichia kudriavzevii]
MAKKGGKKGKEAPVQQPESDSDWEDGAKKPSKKQLEQAAKKQEQLEKKKERELLLQMEEASIKSKKGGKTKSHKKDDLDDALNQFGPKGTISADGLDDSLAALTLLKKDAVTNKDLDRHPERRFKAALASYTERRLPEIKKENPGLRKQQMEQLIYKEFQKSPENPFNQETNISYDANTEEVIGKKKEIRDKRSKKYEK